MTKATRKANMKRRKEKTYDCPKCGTQYDPKGDDKRFDIYICLGCHKNVYYEDCK